MSTPRNPESLTVDELIAASAELADRADGLIGRLDRITSTAASAEHGIEVTVNLDGMLTDLRLSRQSLALSPPRLAAEIFRLAQQAAGSALSEGIEVLAPVAGAELTAELTGFPPTPDAEPKPARRDDHGGDEDFSAIETWALPR